MATLLYNREAATRTHWFPTKRNQSMGWLLDVSVTLEADLENTALWIDEVGRALADGVQ